MDDSIHLPRGEDSLTARIAESQKFVLKWLTKVNPML